MKKEKIAEVAYMINRAYCYALGGTSVPEWKDAAEWQKESALNGVQFHIENPNVTPSVLHENWLKDKAKDGWKYGKEKDVNKKTHPCFLPYEDLPAEQKAEDYLFKQIVKSLSDTDNTKINYLDKDTGEKKGIICTTELFRLENDKFFFHCTAGQVISIPKERVTLIEINL